MIESIKERLKIASKENTSEIYKLESALPHYRGLQAGLGQIINSSIDQIQKLPMQEQPQAIVQLVQSIPRFIDIETKKVNNKIIAIKAENVSIRKTLEIIDDEALKYERIKKKMATGEITSKKSRSKHGNRPEKIKDIRKVIKNEKK